MELLVELVDPKDLRLKANLGGGGWKKLKMGTQPEFDKLQNAGLWEEGRYMHLRPYLLGASRPPRAALEETMVAESGFPIRSFTIKVPKEEEPERAKVVTVGEPVSVLLNKEVHLLLHEATQEYGADLGLFQQYMASQSAYHIAWTGSDDAMEKTSMALPEGMAPPMFCSNINMVMPRDTVDNLTMRKNGPRSCMSTVPTCGPPRKSTCTTTC